MGLIPKPDLFEIVSVLVEVDLIDECRSGRVCLPHTDHQTLFLPFGNNDIETVRSESFLLNYPHSNETEYMKMIVDRRRSTTVFMRERST